MAPLVVDAEAVREFLDRGEQAFPQPEWARLAATLAARRRQAREVFSSRDGRWSRAPAAIRLSEEERQGWEERLEPHLDAIEAGDAVGFLRAVAPGEPPPWVVDWGTYWISCLFPDRTWWARWLYLPGPRTGALPLIVEEPAALEADPTLLGRYARVEQGVAFFGEVVASWRRLPQVPDPDRGMVGLALVYAVYLFTMAAWRMTTEFTQVLPPFPAVVRSLLGLKRWEEKV